jgi:hypothetical protein
MRATSAVAKGLIVAGVIVGGAAGVALALGLRLDQLPGWMITVGMYKLAFIAAAGLLVAGAVLGRAARGMWRRGERDHARPEAIQSGAWEPDASPPPQPDPVDRDRRSR